MIIGMHLRLNYLAFFFKFGLLLSGGSLFGQAENEKKDDEPKIYYVNVYFWFKDLADKTILSSDLKSFQIFTAYANAQCSDSNGRPELNPARSDLPSSETMSAANLESGLVRCVLPFFINNNYVNPLNVKVRVNYNKATDDPISEVYERVVSGQTFYNAGLHLKDPQVIVLKTYPIKLEADLKLELMFPQKEKTQLEKQFEKSPLQFSVKEGGSTVACRSEEKYTYRCKLSYSVTLPVEDYEKNNIIHIGLNSYNFEIDEKFIINIKGDNRRFHISARPADEKGSLTLCSGYKKYMNPVSGAMCAAALIRSEKANAVDFGRLTLDANYNLILNQSQHAFSGNYGFRLHYDILNKLTPQMPAIHFESGYSVFSSAAGSFKAVPVLVGAGWFFPHAISSGSRDWLYGQVLGSLSAGVSFFVDEFADETEVRYPLTIKLLLGYEFNFYSFGIVINASLEWLQLKSSSSMNSGINLGLSYSL